MSCPPGEGYVVVVGQWRVGQGGGGGVGRAGGGGAESAVVAVLQESLGGAVGDDALVDGEVADEDRSLAAGGAFLGSCGGEPGAVGLGEGCSGGGEGALGYGEGVEGLLPALAGGPRVRCG